ncbi:MAG: phytanoyl-CoA dioxygenase family protein [Acidobacteria bacterium]|nr:phytanoyl-CoA dioxygenase family protein [Acidobacteriota bacterium]
MILDIKHPSATDLDAAAAYFEENGYFRLSGIGEVTATFRSLVADAIGMGDDTLSLYLDPRTERPVFPLEIRQRLARVNTPRPLALALLERLEGVLARLIGPLIHVSSSFHAQFKGGHAKPVDHGGYLPDAQFMEVHGAYLLHQDFAGASIPTSPSGVTLWIGLNSCSDWRLRLYPGTHRLGLICNRWLSLDDERLEAVGNPVEIEAKEGAAVVFNAMLLHGTGVEGPQRRVSCDIRFFPFCGFLPSEVHVLGRDPLGTLARDAERPLGPTLSAPRWEDRVFLGNDVSRDEVPRHSVLNWVNYIARAVRGDWDRALPHLSKFVNERIGLDSVSLYAAKFHGRAIHGSTLQQVRERLARCGIEASRLAPLDELIAQVGARAGGGALTA